jgi:hypothetical protein
MSAKTIETSTSAPCTPDSLIPGQSDAWSCRPVKHRLQRLGFFSHGVKPKRLKIADPGALNGAAHKRQRGLDGTRRNGFG